MHAPCPDATPDEVYEWMQSLPAKESWDWMQSPAGRLHRRTIDRIRVTLKLRDAGIPGEWAWQAALVLVPDELSAPGTTSHPGGQDVSLNSMPGIVPKTPKGAVAYAIHQNTRAEVRLSPDLAYTLTLGGGGPGMGVPVVAISDEDDGAAR